MRAYGAADAAWIPLPTSFRFPLASAVAWLMIAPAGSAARNSARSTLTWATVDAWLKVKSICSCRGAPARSRAVIVPGSAQEFCVSSCAGSEPHPTMASLGLPARPVTVMVCSRPTEPRVPDRSLSSIAPSRVGHRPDFWVM